MKHNRIVYFLAHALLVAIGTAVSVWGGTLGEPWKTTLVAIGTSLIATGAAGMLIWVYLVQVERNAARLEAFSRAGLDWIYPRRAAQIRSEYADRLNGASVAIDILGFGLKDFRRDYLDELGSLAARAPVRILLLDPTSIFASQRDVEEGQSPGVIASEVREFVRQYRIRYGAAPPAGLEVRYYTSLPLLNVFRIDNEIFFGPYLVGQASSNTITMRAARGPLYDQLRQHFDEVWDNHSNEI